MFRIDLPERMRTARFEAGFSRPELAAAAGVDPATVYNIEHGVTTPRGQTVYALAKALGKDPSYFLASGAEEVAS